MSGVEENSPDYLVDELIGLFDQSQAEIIASHYAAISEEYEPVSMSHFPEYSKILLNLKFQAVRWKKSSSQ